MFGSKQIPRDGYWATKAALSNGRLSPSAIFAPVAFLTLGFGYNNLSEYVAYSFQDAFLC